MADSEFMTLAVKAGADELLAAETAGGRADQFIDLDPIAANVLQSALAGAHAVTVKVGDRAMPKSDTVHINGLAPANRDALDHAFRLENQQARGAWFLPEDATLLTGTCNLPSYLRSHGPYALAVAADDNARVRFASNSDPLAVWALLQPLFAAVLEPVMLRASGLPPDRAAQLEEWSRLEAAYAELGIGSGVLDPFRPGGSWTKLDREGQQAARLTLLDDLARQDLLAVVRRYRAGRVAALTAAFAKKCRRGTPLARQVLTRALQPTLTAYFRGDWLAYLSYLGVPPNPDETIVTALPEPRLIIGTEDTAAQAAAESGLPIDEVRAMLTAYMGGSSTQSPVLERVAVMRRWWQQFDEVHARQRPGMRPLWGLVDEGIYVLDNQRGPTPRLYRELLSGDLVADVDRLWDGCVLPRWPERIVSEPHPHKLMAETAGPALTLWHGIAMTAWYVSESGFSRTTLDQLRHYHRRELAALDEAGTPVDDQLFKDLARADTELLGPPQQRWRNVRDQTTDNGIAVTLSLGGWQHRDGFERVRDLITRHRRTWTDAHLDTYLRHRWDSELHAVSREFHRAVAAKGTPPTLKAFARVAGPAANHWFNGDLTGLYAALGEKAPAATRRVDLLPVDAHEFVTAMYVALGGKPYDEDLAISDNAAYRRLWSLSKLAGASVYYLQAQEALGRPPDEREFEAKKYEWPWPGDQDEGWPVYQQTIEQTRCLPPGSFPRAQVALRPPVMSGNERIIPANNPTTPELATPVVAHPTAADRPSMSVRDGGRARGLLGRFRRRHGG
jgi:hypothetical protein